MFSPALQRFPARSIRPRFLARYLRDRTIREAVEGGAGAFNERSKQV